MKSKKMNGSGYPGYCGGKMTESQCTWSTNSCKSRQVGGKNTKKKNKNNSKKKGGNNTNLLYNGYCGVTGPENQHLISQCTYNLPCGPSVNFKGGDRSKKKYNKKGGDIFSGVANMIADAGENDELEMIELMGNRVGVEGAYKIGDAFADGGNAKISHLWISMDDSIKDVGVRNLCIGLRTSRIRSLKLEFVGLTIGMHISFSTFY